MEIRQLTIILESVICLAILIPLLLSLLPAVRLDGFRQDMFAVRDELFDYAASGSLSFNDPAYRLLRQLMNGFIRYGHQLTFFRVCMTIIQWKTSGREQDLTWTTKWERALSDVADGEVRLALNIFHNRATMLVATRLVFGSPILVIVLLCAMVTTTLHKGWHSLKQLLDEAASTTVSHVVDTRLLEEEAIKAAAA